VTAFAPSIYNNIISPSSRTTRIFASTTIVEAEDMYLEKATQSDGDVLEKPDVRFYHIKSYVDINEGRKPRRK